MIELKGMYNDCKVYANEIDEATKGQLITLLNQSFVAGSKIRIMPDTHAGAGCVIGTTMTLQDKVVPNLVGVDIGCFTGETQIWCSTYYKGIKELAVAGVPFIVDAYDEERNCFVKARAVAAKTRENAALVAVTYVKESTIESQRKAVTVRCTPDHKFLIVDKDTDKLYWQAAEKLEAGTRIWAEDIILVVKSVEPLEEREDVYCLNVPEYHNFAIMFGAIVHNCGMLAVKLKDKRINFTDLDSVIHKQIPSGMEVNKAAVAQFDDLDNIKAVINKERAELSLGTLGGGNHFIEVDKDNEGNHWLVIHTGSRHLGLEVCNYYQQAGYEQLNVATKGDIKEMRKALIEEYKAKGKDTEIGVALQQLNEKYKAEIIAIPYELAYVDGALFEDYIHDMRIVQAFAVKNRATIANRIMKAAGLKEIDRFETIHNYIDCDNMILRKGSISAQEGERVLIPMNMRDGSLLCVGKGNPDWNYSAPHGAGRLMSRRQARENIAMSDYKQSMQGIFTTCVNRGTVDESPMAYKSMESIMEQVTETVDIVEVIKPVYNFKASEE